MMLQHYLPWNVDAFTTVVAIFLIDAHLFGFEFFVSTFLVPSGFV